MNSNNIIVWSMLFVCLGQNETLAQDFRLPTNIIPDRYRLQITSILDPTPGYTQFSAHGKVWIQVNCTAATSFIRLHAVALEIDTSGITVRDSFSGSVPIQNFTYEEYDFFRINLHNSLSAGQQYEIFIPYIAPISESRLDGIYLDSYVDPATNETKYVSTTLFAAIAARRAFPCFDEPQLKTPFDIEIGHHDKYHSLSNMQVMETTNLPEPPNFKLDKFLSSPPMSTYLVCMIVSDLAHDEDNSTGIPHRIYAPYYFIERGGGKYAANLSANVLSAFEGYYDMEYPLRKLDNVALPQFFYNAMENWGLMTYADRVLLYFEGETSPSQKYQLSLTLSHEVAHNFFGNMVTCQWWTWIWLNEGFATFVSHVGLNMTYPDLRPWDMFVNRVYQVGMAFDESVRTHPIASEPATAEAIDSVYDRIVYEKAASVIRMMEWVVTERNLQEALRRYLKRWQYLSAKQDDLFLEVDTVIEETGFVLPTTFKGIMDTWTLQTGYPIISVKRTSPTQLRLTQEQGVRNGVPTGDEKWWIPVELQVLAEQTSTLIWMTEDSNETLVNGVEGFFVLNPKSLGYYRVLYSSVLLDGLSHRLQQNWEADFTPLMRAKLFDDFFYFVFEGLIPLEKVLQMSSYASNETDFLVWATLGRGYKYLIQIFRETEDGTLLKNHVLKQISQARQRSSAAKLTGVELAYLEEELASLQSFVEFEAIISASVAEEIVMSVRDNNPNINDIISLSVGLGKGFESRLAVLKMTTANLKMKGNRTEKKDKFWFHLLQEICQFAATSEEADLLSDVETFHESIADCIFMAKRNEQRKTFLKGHLPANWAQTC